MEASDSLVVPVTEEAALATTDAARRFGFRFTDIHEPCSFTSSNPDGITKITGRTFIQTKCLLTFFDIGAICTYFYSCDY